MQRKVNDLQSGKYSVRISVGPAFTTRKMESASNMLEFMRNIPQSAPMIADLIAGAQEWPDAERIAERLKKAVPPNLLEEDEKEAADPQAQAAKQQQMMQAQQQAQMQQVAAQAAVKKQVAEAVEAEADAVKAQAEAAKAQAELQQMQAMQARLMLPQNVGPMPFVPGVTG